MPPEKLNMHDKSFPHTAANVYHSTNINGSIFTIDKTVIIIDFIEVIIPENRVLIETATYSSVYNVVPLNIFMQCSTPHAVKNDLYFVGSHSLNSL